MSGRFELFPEDCRECELRLGTEAIFAWLLMFLLKMKPLAGFSFFILVKFTKEFLVFE